MFLVSWLKHFEKSGYIQAARRQGLSMPVILRCHACFSHVPYTEARIELCTHSLVRIPFSYVWFEN